MRLLPRSIRARDTLLAAVISVLVFGVLAVAADLIIRDVTTSRMLDEIQVAGRRVSGAVRDGTLTQPIPPGPPGVVLQVVDRDGRVRFTTRGGVGRPPVSDLRPTTAKRIHDYIECGMPGYDRCMLVEAIRATTAPDSVVVYAAKPMPALLVTGLLEALLGAAVLALSTLATWTTWHVVGRTLRPVEAIRAQLSEISASDLSRRVPQPPGEDEIAQLARTANETLDRLERAVERQRQFASDASHELRTPIAALRANLEDAVMHPEDTDLQEVVRAALRDTDRLESIITDLLLLARIGTECRTVQERIDFPELVRTELALRTPPVTVRTVLPDRLPPVCGVRVQLARLLHNLLDNAERYADSQIEVAVAREDGRLVCTVTDDGIGIPEADRERVFERFTRLDTARSRSAGGTGLGLAIARDIAHAHGGTLCVEDSPRGARFALRLPFSPEPARQGE
ncbi:MULTISPECIES: HAMP domain-containing sensor histidine kinase [Thermomonospora]|uniref:histidine kinase n=1 Tax=Thermomonospora curvata (strain ATCC 19995 / DSM 43183 / JCM 3096 / KCTC 9072 / NBRC 15933 / NCIMB 10081 / Henssen B9) TaxID=471852 RepID=D1A767_THECD|nr:MULTISPECIES: HAMP domain-containing sensor histidine kinase [Thermomonospora]ACZ00273.1 histidine kinase [Thermomonospora curvata DSM 43183]PKK12128.1 MAG: sensor histidine kinase [Thermomonospora sp. CIF 1]